MAKKSTGNHARKSKPIGSFISWVLAAYVPYAKSAPQFNGA